jgi:hypothetical protein
MVADPNESDTTRQPRRRLSRLRSRGHFNGVRDESAFALPLEVECKIHKGQVRESTTALLLTNQDRSLPKKHYLYIRHFLWLLLPSFVDIAHTKSRQEEKVDAGCIHPKRRIHNFLCGPRIGQESSTDFNFVRALPIKTSAPHD